MAAAATATKTNWACTICTYENQLTSKLCEMCGTANPSVKDDGWKCVMCTFVNPSNTSACNVCGAPSPVNNDLTGKQICGSCTTINFANANTCTVCGQPLSHKIIQADDNGQLQQMDLANSNNNGGMIGMDPNTDLNAISQFVGDQVSQDISNSNANNLPQYANPFDGSSLYSNGYNNGYNGYNNAWQPPQQQQQQYPQPQQMQFHSHNSMPPMQPQVMNNNSGGFFGGFSFGGNQNNNSYSHGKKSKKGKKRSSKHKKYGNNNQYNNNDNDDDSGPKFKDVSEIFKNDANDQERLKKEEEEIKILYEMYEHVYLNLNSKKGKLEANKISDIVSKMIEFIPQEHFDEVKKNKEEAQKNGDDKKVDDKLCQVCYCEFDNDEGQQIVMKKYCNHAMICKSCFQQNLKIKIKDDDITPWIPCAAPNCKAPVCCELLFAHLDTKSLYKFAEGFIRKHLARNNNWVKCQTKKCDFGWMILDKNVEKQHKLKCKSCGKKHTVCKDPIKSDKGFNELIKSGVLRLCPKCSLPTMKDKGMCNVMHCGKCGIYWNWRTRETGTSSSQLKNRARNNGTLWEPGELAYQQQLQRTNLPEFKRLLERNGIKYDPNYVRGTR